MVKTLPQVSNLREGASLGAAVAKRGDDHAVVSR